MLCSVLMLGFVASLLLVAGAPDDCKPLMKCKEPFDKEKFFFDKDSMFFIVKDEKKLDKVCKKLTNLKSCISSHKGACKDGDIVKENTFLQHLFEYICTPWGKQVALASGNSTCKPSPELDSWLSDWLDQCQWHYHFASSAVEIAKERDLQSSEVCRLHTILDMCVKSGVESKCGLEMAQVVEKTWLIWNSEELVKHNCSIPGQATL